LGVFSRAGRAEEREMLDEHAEEAGRIAVTGIKPTGTPHIGNYLGMIRPALHLARNHTAFYFIADLHALTTITDKGRLRSLTYEVAAAWLALGLESSGAVLYRQSDVPEVCELAWILSCATAKGTLNRAHAYKARSDANVAARRPMDHGINAGVYFYPVLMAADILLLGAEVVPVGGDQQQHLEMTRDIATSFNSRHGTVFRLPEASLALDVAAVPGLDGRKMSKSYGNIIPIFASGSELKRLVMRIVTDSRSVDEPKDPETCPLFAMYRGLATASQTAAMRARYERGSVGYGEVKRDLLELMNRTFEGARSRYAALLEDRSHLDAVLKTGAEAARQVARGTMTQVRRATGVG
jgi:tryptophanyl-tRNA synthetase